MKVIEFLMYLWGKFHLKNQLRDLRRTSVYNKVHRKLNELKRQKITLKKKDSAKLCPTLVIPWTIACQAPLSVRFFRQEYWSELPFPFPGDLPDRGIKPGSSAIQANSLPAEPPGKSKMRSRETELIVNRHEGSYEERWGRARCECSKTELWWLLPTLEIY